MNIIMAMDSRGHGFRHHLRLGLGYRMIEVPSVWPAVWGVWSQDPAVGGAAAPGGHQLGDHGHLHPRVRRRQVPHGFVTYIPMERTILRGCFSILPTSDHLSAHCLTSHASLSPSVSPDLAWHRLARPRSVGVGLSSWPPPAASRASDGPSHRYTTHPLLSQITTHTI